MKRTLLLIPVFLIALIACREKHLTSTSPTPGMPDPNGYNTVPPPAATEAPDGSAEIAIVTNNNTVGDTLATNVTTPAGTGTPTNPEIPGDVKVDSTKLCRLVVSFISKGDGIDYEAQGRFDKWLAQDVRGGFTYTKSPWGREGEVNYCFNLNAKSKADQVIFVKEVREFFSGNEKVLVSEWTECMKGSNSTLVNQDLTEPVRDTTKQRLVVSFMSPGDGIDATAKSALDKYLAKHADIKYTIIYWGHEGEMDYVFLIGGRTAADQEKIVKEVRDVIGKNDRVFVEENKVPHASNANAVPPAPVESTDLPQRDTSNTARLVVSFISKGQGIDHKTQEEFEKWLAERPQFTYEKKGWGREGEVNYCFFMTGMQTRQQDIFVRDVRTYFGSNDMVVVEEWGKCDKRK